MIGTGPPIGQSWLPWFWLGAADLTIADRNRSWATLIRGHGHTFVPLWAHGVFPATVSTGSLSYHGHAHTRGGAHVDTRARVLAVPEPSQLASFGARQRISPSRSP